MLIQKINNLKIVAYNLVCAKPWAFFCSEKNENFKQLKQKQDEVKNVVELKKRTNAL